MQKDKRRGVPTARSSSPSDLLHYTNRRIVVGIPTYFAFSRLAGLCIRTIRRWREAFHAWQALLAAADYKPRVPKCPPRVDGN